MRSRILTWFLRGSFLCGVLLCAAFLMSFGCGHTNKGALDPTTIERPYDPDPGKETDFTEPTAKYEGVHVMAVYFASPMSPSTVEVTMTDDLGQAFTSVKQEWAPGRTVLYLKGPYLFCHSYDITLKAGAEDGAGVKLKEDMIFTLDTGENPFDMDRSSSCKADVVLSPVFTDGPDVAVLTGDSISRMVPEKLSRKADIDKRNIFYVDYSYDYEDGGRALLVPALTSGGTPGVAKLFTDVGAKKYFAIDLWGEYEPVFDTPSSDITYELALNSSRDLAGPFEAGDLNGDGIDELIVSSDVPLNSSTVFQEIFLLEGPVTLGNGLWLTDVTGSSHLLGELGEERSPFYAVGDTDGDGMDDLAYVRSVPSSLPGQTNNYVTILRGRDNLNMMFIEDGVDDEETINVWSGKAVADVTGGDVDGDGFSDVLITEMERKFVSGAYRNVNPRIAVFFGGESFNGKTTVSPDSEMIFKSAGDTSMAVRALGDINGDGIDDIGMHVIEQGVYGAVDSSKIHIFTGRGLWFNKYYMSVLMKKEAALVIDASWSDTVSWMNDLVSPKIGDIDNDGYYDFMLVSDDGTDRTAHFFFGGISYNTNGMKRDLEEADVMWKFR